MEQRNKIKNYLRSDRKGREANHLEREAMTDPFLYEALEGFMSGVGDPEKGIDLLKNKLKLRTHSRFYAIMHYWKVGIAAIVLIGLGMIIFDKQEDRTLPLVQSVQPDLREDSVPEADMQIASAMEHAVVQDAVQEKNVKRPGTESGEENKVAVMPAMAAMALTKTHDGEVILENEGTGGVLPVDGMEAFRQYIRKSLVYPEDARKEGLEGRVKLAFIVNQYGRPSRIRTTEWISYSCNREAIRLLEKGPDWIYTGTQTPAYVTITFRLKK